jgi:hypothetical protein
VTISRTRAIPILRMFDEALTKQFYVEFLEFEIAFEARFDPGVSLYMGVPPRGSDRSDVELPGADAHGSGR